jgi:hypothetical protein
MSIIRAIVAGERNPKELTKFRHPQMKASEEDFEKGLQGNWRAEHLFSLKQALTMYDFIKDKCWSLRKKRSAAQSKRLWEKLMEEMVMN